MPLQDHLMPLQESHVYTVKIGLQTIDGELPTLDEVQEMIGWQMAGELDEDTGLSCFHVKVISDEE